MFNRLECGLHISQPAKTKCGASIASDPLLRANVCTQACLAHKVKKKITVVLFQRIIASADC